MLDRVMSRPPRLAFVVVLLVVWGHSAAVLTRTVDTHIAGLRRKLEENPATPAIS